MLRPSSRLRIDHQAFYRRSREPGRGLVLIGVFADKALGVNMLQTPPVSNHFGTQFDMTLEDFEAFYEL